MLSKNVKIKALKACCYNKLCIGGCSAIPAAAAGLLVGRPGRPSCRAVCAGSGAAAGRLLARPGRPPCLADCAGPGAAAGPLVGRPGRPSCRAAFAGRGATAGIFVGRPCRAFGGHVAGAVIGPAGELKSVLVLSLK